MLLITTLLSVIIGTSAEYQTTKVVEFKEANSSYVISGWTERNTKVSGADAGSYHDVVYLRVESAASEQFWQSEIERAIAIEGLVLTGNREFIAITVTHNGIGHRVTRWGISDSLAPNELESLNCYWPYLAPNKKWVFYQWWYPRMGTPEEYRQTSTWLVDITHPKLEPKLAYPPGNSSGRAMDGRIHAALTNGIPPLWSPDSRRLYYFDKLSTEHEWTGAVVSLVEIILGDEMTIDKVTTYPIAVKDFAKPEANLDELAFYPRDLHWGEDGIIGGRLKQKPGWKSQDFYMTRDGKFVDPDDMKK